MAGRSRHHDCRSAHYPSTGNEQGNPFETPDGRLRMLRVTLLIMVLALLAQPATADENSERATAHLLQAEIELQRNEYKAAAEEYAKAAELSDDVEVARQATRVSYSYGFNEDALRAAERWLELDEDNDEAMLYVAQLQLRNGDLKDARRSFRRLLDRGKEPVDERLVVLIPFLSEEDPEDADWLMR